MRRIRVATSAEPVLPADLLRSAPRPVEYTLKGLFAIGLIVLLTAGSLGISVWLALKLTEDAAIAEQLRREGAETQAAVVRLKRANGGDAQTNLTYRFELNGREYEGKGRLRKNDPRRETVTAGSIVIVRYLPSRPAENWMAGDEPHSTPAIAALGAPAVAFPMAGLVLFFIGRQRRLLSDGRAAMARISRVEKKSGEHGTIWRTHFDWELPSGATRSGRVDKQGKPPAPGNFVPLLYDRDNPKRYALYPTCLVRVARW